MFFRCWRLTRSPRTLRVALSHSTKYTGWRTRDLQWQRRWLTSNSNWSRKPLKTRLLLGALAATGVGGGLWVGSAFLHPAKPNSTPHAVQSHSDADNIVFNSQKDDLAESDGLLSSLRERGQRLFQLVVVDGVFELLLTVLRTGELIVYFIPLFIAYPAVWFGKRNLDRGGESAGALWWYKLLRIQMSRAGPTFVKLSQWAASRTDLFNMQLCLELGKLHDSNQVHSPQKSQRAIAKAFGVDSIEQIFESFDDRPLGAGAVAQVHRGRISDAFIERQLAVATDFGSKRALEKLKANPEVAVKVLHPRVERKIRRDLRIMEWGARALSLLPGIKWLSLPEEVAVFGNMMMSQVDLRTEARNAERFAANFSGRAGVAFPRVYLPLDSKDVLVETFCDGIPLRAFLDIDGHTPFDRELGARGLDAFLHMLIYDNFVHADLHPGNIMVSLSPPFVGSPLDRFVEDFYDMSPFNRGRGMHEKQLPSSAQVHRHVRSILDSHEAGEISTHQKNKEIHAYADLLYQSGFTASLVFLDCGLVTLLDDFNRRNFIDLFESVCTFDGNRAGNLMIDRCLTPELVVSPDVFVLRIQDIILRVRKVSLQLSKLTFSEIFEPVMRAVRIHHVRLAPDFINIIMAMFILEGIGRRLDPESDVLRAALPMLRSWLKEDAKNELTYPQHARGSTSPSTASWNLLKVWMYIELREYLDRVRSWGYDDQEFFGEFSPFLTADSSLA
ncbi:hypothetical protein GGH14_000240 [Coemansia sp. RSA 370]|nr:hypothetical protein J3F81_003820 [Coemansia sp. RSA 371]KAJ2284236.1 hypothetical protein GGH14_000240 [Coemansia sp. RSA 370]KAJ2291920.1 hypothetical protein IW141_002297 [Coemansia sp. RSA 355]